ncbi:hypothetical protein JTE90_026294 [Oedothorax gibbosus]|uniref:Nicotinamide N-methyltransferase n=1 Tax=Oedothorax gibbosus TaxID=931172 RepID=A0AAV6U2T4_9ARAC|nr:hypothetical protein JTE90_026294 [Oedothorax gibbosus]
MIRPNFEFMLEFLSDVVESGQFEGTKVLEIGSGATVHGIASASRKYTSIVQSDYVLDNCEELRKWHLGESTLDWTQFLELVLSIDEKKGKPPITIPELESRIRTTVKRVVRGDLLSDQILPLENLTPDTLPPYDLIICILCVETVAQDKDSYGDILKRLNGLLRIGGGLVVCGYENGSPWIVEGHTFHHVKLSMADIKYAFVKAGFGIRELKTLPKIESAYEYDYDNLFCIAAEKL